MTGEDGDFYIFDGVHRAVAARELRLIGVLATLHDEGSRPRLIVVDPARLYSPKSEIKRFYKNRDFHELVALMGTVEGRTRLRPIEVERLGNPGQTGSVPLVDVRILDEDGGDDDG